MFTGLVEAIGVVAGVDRGTDGVRLTVASPLAARLSAGDSVAVSGVCLTAVAPEPERFGADVIAETLRRSALGPLEEGSAVNLELPLRATDRLGGHVVQGHVDGLGTVEEVTDEGFARVLWVRCAPELLRYVVEKGSIAVDGVSLTVAGVDADGFSIALIPETLERTTLGRVRPGSTVNLEVDVIAKYVEKLASSALARPPAPAPA